VALFTVLLSGCAGHYELASRAVTGGGPSWLQPAWTPDQARLEGWREAVGPPLLLPLAADRAAAESPRLTIVTWNTAVGDADVVRFVHDLQARIGPRAPLVLLLQEVYRGGLPTRRLPGPAAAFAARLGALRDHDDPDIAAVARATGLTLYYAPSMRNGSPAGSDEDRGNAILANVPLKDLAALELPFERQRRVALAATVGGHLDSGAPWSIRLVCAHLDNMVGPHRLWIAGSEFARTRQARALVDYLDDAGPSVLAGDFNTWFGFADRAYEETARAFPGAPPSDRGATFRGLLRLDHMFFRLPPGWQATYQRAGDSYGSDHRALVATIAPPEAVNAD
jgi:endonuclease/exonuclease/phosphatase family metal-dependent hydrolase